MFACMECGQKFNTTKAAEKASRDGCPKCGGVDVDLDPSPGPDLSTAMGRLQAKRSQALSDEMVKRHAQAGNTSYRD